MELQIRTEGLKPTLRKVISVLMAVIMIMSTMSVAVTAFDAESTTATYEGVSEEYVEPTTEPTTTQPMTEPTTEESPVTEEVTDGDTEGYFDYYVTDEGNAVISSYTGNQEHIVIPSEIDGYPVTEIGYYSFYNNYSVRSVIIPEGVRSIGINAFGYCYYLEDVTLPTTLEVIDSGAFQGTALSEMYIPEGVRDIEVGSCYNLQRITVDENNAVYSSDNDGILYNKDKTELLKYPAAKTDSSFTVPDGVKTIGYEAFYYARNLEKISLPDSLTKIAFYAFGCCENLSDITLPENLETIGANAFESCSDIESINIPASVTEIGNHAFRSSGIKSITADEDSESFSNDEYGVLFNKDKTELVCWPFASECTSYQIPDSVTSIGECAFYDVYKLENVVFGENVTSVGNGAFYGCYNTSITFNGKLEKIGGSAFYSCRKLTDIPQSENLKEIGMSAFSVCEFESVNIPEGVTVINENTFASCRKLKKVTLHDGIEVIGSNAFSNCSKLQDIMIPDGVTVISDSAFACCSELVRVVIGSGTEKIQGNAFVGCEKLTDVHYSGTEEDWGNIEIYYGNEYLTGASIIFCEGAGEEVAAKAPTCTEEGCTEGLVCSVCGSVLSGCRTVPVYHPDEDATDGICDLCGESANDIDVGETLTLDIGRSETVYLRFAPSQTGYYRFCANNTEVGEAKGGLYDSDKEEIFGDYAWNFDYNSYQLGTYLTAGEVYYWGAGYNWEDNTGSYDVSLEYYDENPDYDGEDSICNGFTYRLDSKNQATITGFYGEVRDVVIPSEVDGYTVTEIGSHALSYRYAVKSIIIPDSVERIGFSAFENCFNVKEIIISSSLRFIEEYAFWNCDELEKVYYNGHSSVWDAVEVLHGNEGLLGAEFTFCPNEELTEVEGSDATCTEDGYTDGVYCDVCNTWISGHEKISAGHTDEDIDGICDVCDESANDIDVGETVTVDINEGETVYLKFVPTQSGYYRFCADNIESGDATGYICDSDKEVLETTYAWWFDGCSYQLGTYLTAGEVYYWGAGYDWEDNTGSYDVSLEYYDENPDYDGEDSICNGFTYTVNEEDEATITGYYGVMPNLVIPSEVDGYPVTAIGTWAFSDREYIKTVTISEGVKEIKRGAFSCCYNMEKISLPESLVKIGEYSLRDNCLTEIVIPDAVETIGYEAFGWCCSLEKVTIGKSVTRIGYEAFWDCYNIEEVYYNGHEAAWENIRIEYGNGYLRDREINFCTSEDVTEVEGLDATCTEDGYTDGVYCNTCDSWVSGHEVISAGHTDEDNDGYCEVCEKAANDIEPGQTKKVVYGMDETVYFAFTPEKSGWYSFYSISDGADMYGQLLDADKNYLDGDSYSYGNEFCIEAYLMKGVKYYFSSTVWWFDDEDGDYEYKVKLIEGSYNGEDHGYGGNVTDGDIEEDEDLDVGYSFYYKGYYAVVGENNTCIITEIEYTRSVVTVPGTLKGYTVTGITDEAIYWCRHGTNTFNFPATVTSIPLSVLLKGGFSDLMKINVEEGNEYYKSIDGILYNADGTELLFCPSGYEGVFVIPAALESFGENALTHANGITDFEIEEGNTSFVYEDGILYNYEKTRLIRAMTAEGDVEIADTVEVIDSSAFINLDEIESVSIPDNVTEIAYATFYDCDLLSEVDLPENIEVIGDYAFDNCEKIKEVDFGDSLRELGVNAFRYTGLESVTLPDSLEICENGAFSYCEDIANVDLGAGLVEIPGMMFYGAEALTEITFPENVEYIGSSAFGGTGIKNVVIPDSVMEMEGAFSGCDKLETAIIGNGVVSMRGAFSDCKSLVSAKIGNSVEYMHYAFAECENLESVEFAEGFTGGYMYESFRGCVKLTDVDLPSTVDHITYRAFDDCESLSGVELPESIRSVGVRSFNNTAWHNSQADGATYLSRVLYDFKGEMPKEYNLQVKEGTTVIADGALCNESRLTSVVLNDGMKYIGEDAFYSSGIRSIVLPESVVSIDGYAFARCKELKDVYYRGTQEQWDEILIDEGNDELIYADIHFGTCKKHINTEDFAQVKGDCTEEGYTAGTYCYDCGSWISGHKLIESGHINKDRDKYCDVCNEKLSDILPGETLTVSVEEGETEYLKFTPSVNGSYSFYSESEEDLCGYLYDSEYNLIDSDNVDGYNDFWITYNRLTPGNLYYWGAGYCSDSDSGSFDVTLERDGRIYGSEKGYNYVVTDGNATITGYSGSGKYLDIPSEVDGFTVTRIASYAFEWNESVVYAYIPDTVVSIGEGAFYDCGRLKNVDFGNSVTTLGNGVFRYCYNLEKVEIPASLTEMGNNIFWSCESIKSFTVDKNNPQYASDKYGALYDKNMTRLIQYPRGSRNTSYTLPSSVTDINADGLGRNPYLKEIKVDADNRYYTSDSEGVLYSKNFTRLIAYPNSRKDTMYTVPGTVEYVYCNAFSGNKYLETLKLNEGVQGIAVDYDSDWGYSFSSSLRELYIPSTVTTIDADAFGYAEETFTIYGRTDSYAYEFYEENRYNDWWPFYGNLEFAPYYTDELFVTLKTENYAVKSNIYCYGFATEGARVYIYDGDVLIGNNAKFKGNKYSKWEANVSLHNPVDTGSDHVITAVVVDSEGNKTVSNPVTVHYEKNAVVFQDFQMVHSGSYKLQVTPETINKVHTLTWIPEQDNNDTYRVKFLNSDKLVELYIVSTTSNGSTSRIQLERAGDDTWVGRGSFGQETPGVLSFEGLFKKDFEMRQIGGNIRITYLIDPSGNVFDFTTDNPIDGVTATVYYKDGEGNAVEWDAEYYSQLNPVITGKDGFFQWDVPEGKWQVKFEKEGYETLVSDWMDVPPAVTDLRCFMVSTDDLEVTEAYYKNGVTTVYLNKYVDISEIDSAEFTSSADEELSVEIGETKYGVFDSAVYKEDETCDEDEGANCITVMSDSYPGTITTTLDGLTITPVNLTESYSFEVTDTQDVHYIGDKIVLTLAEENGKAITDELKIKVSVSNEAIFDNEIPATVTFDGEGRAVLELEAGMPGEAEVVFDVAGTKITYTVSIAVTDESHECEYSEYTIVPATCRNYGYEYRTCCECGNVEYECDYCLEDHDFDEVVNADTLKKAADCFAPAEYYMSCSFCGLVNEEETFSYGEAEEHIPGEVFEDNRTETEYDLVVKCKYCAYEFSRETVKIETECTHTDCTTVSYIAPTCTAEGRTEGKICNGCGETVVASKVISKTGHKETVLKGYAATCTKDGLTDGKKCTVCGTTTVGQKAIKAAGHKETILKGYEATYKATGLTEGKQCTVCGTVTVVQQTTEKLTLGKPSGLKVKAVKVASGTKTTLTLTWDNMGDGVKYEVYQKNGKKWTKVGKATSKNSVTVKKLKADTSYKFKVKAIADGATAESKVFTAKTVPLKTTLSLKAGKKQLTASWSTVANITGYEVEYSTAKNFKKNSKVVTIKKAKTKKTTIKKLSKGKKYYVRVRAYKTVNGKKIYSAWSSVKNVKVK